MRYLTSSVGLRTQNTTNHPGNPGRWFLIFEEPGHAPAAFGPPALKAGERQRMIDLAAVEGGSLAGRV